VPLPTPTPLPLARVLEQAIAWCCPRAGRCGQAPPGGGRGGRAGAVHAGGSLARWLAPLPLARLLVQAIAQCCQCRSCLGGLARA
jgi:hypothetical protein